MSKATRLSQQSFDSLRGELTEITAQMKLGALFATSIDPLTAQIAESEKNQAPERLNHFIRKIRLPKRVLLEALTQPIEGISTTQGDEPQTTHQTELFLGDSMYITTCELREDEAMGQEWYFGDDSLLLAASSVANALVTGGRLKLTED